MAALRSKSVPASRSSDRTTDAEEDSSSFPSLQQEPAGDHRVPTWIQELATARSGRHSRASSIVSTRTRFSTTTFDDARSIDIQAGGQTFRISRFGDRVTDTTAPPPYSGLNNDDLFVHRPDTSATEEGRDEYEHGHDHDHGRGHDNVHIHPHRHRYHHGIPIARRHPRRVRIAMPDDEGTLPQNDDDFPLPDTPSRIISDEELRQIILDLPSKLKSALGIDPEQPELENLTLLDAEALGSIDAAPYEASNFGSSSTTLVGGPTHEDKASNGGNVRGILRNAPENAPYQDHGESRWEPSEENTVQRLWNTYNNAKRPRDLTPMLDSRLNSDSQRPSENIKEVRDYPPEESVIPPTVGDLNELSQVYNKVIRELDREHRKQLHARDKELDQLRILLHEKDIVYRQQLKGRDFVIDELKQRLDRLEETMELKIEKATHAVEDLWETRWKEHSQQLMEKCGFLKPAPQANTAGDTQQDNSDALTI